MAIYFKAILMTRHTTPLTLSMESVHIWQKNKSILHMYCCGTRNSHPGTRIIRQKRGSSRRVVVSYKRKYVHKLLVNRLLKPAQEKVWLSELTVLQ